MGVCGSQALPGSSNEGPQEARPPAVVKMSFQLLLLYSTVWYSPRLHPIFLEREVSVLDMPKRAQLCLHSP